MSNNKQPLAGLITAKLTPVFLSVGETPLLCRGMPPARSPTLTRAGILLSNGDPMSKLLNDDYEEATGYDFFDSFIKRIFDKRALNKKQSLRKKEPIASDVRWSVWERDNFTCQHCGARKNLSIDHIHPESKGGKATLENCQTLCKSCNSRKGAK